MTDAILVTKHAMVRYLERKHGRKVKRLCREVRKAGDVAVLQAMERDHGLDVDELRAEMLAPPVRTALFGGASAIKHGGVKFLFGDGKIITVVPTAGRTRGGL